MYPRHPKETPLKPSELPPEAIPAWLHPTSRQYLQNRGISEEEALRYHLHYCTGGEWAHRIIIPIYDGDGQLCAYQGRAVTDHPMRYRTEGPRAILQPWDASEVAGELLCIVEGPFDLFTVNRVVLTVATLGVYPSESQIQELQQLVPHFNLTVIWFDCGALVQALDLQRQLTPYGIVNVIPWENENDPGDCSVDVIKDVLLKGDIP